MLQGHGQRTSSNHKRQIRKREDAKGQTREQEPSVECGPLQLEQHRKLLCFAQRSLSSFVARVSFLGTLCPSVPQVDVSRAGWSSSLGHADSQTPVTHSVPPHGGEAASCN